MYLEDIVLKTSGWGSIQNSAVYIVRVSISSLRLTWCLGRLRSCCKIPGSIWRHHNNTTFLHWLNKKQIHVLIERPPTWCLAIWAISLSVRESILDKRHKHTWLPLETDAGTQVALLTRLRRMYLRTTWRDVRILTPNVLIGVLFLSVWHINKRK